MINDNISAKELLEMISKEKERLIETKKLKKEKELPEVNYSKIINKKDGWEYVRLGDYCIKITDYVASGSFASIKENVKITNNEDYAIMVKTADFANDFTKDLTYTDKKGYDFLKNSNLFGGEIILSNIGSIGKVFKVPYLNRPMTLASNTIMLRFFDDEIRDYIYYYFLSKSGYKQLMKISTGTSMKKFNKTDLKKIIVPIPPVKKQKEIIYEFDKICEAINNRKNIIKDLDNYLDSIFYEMFKDNIKKEEFVILNDICEIITDGTHQTPTYSDNGYIFLSSKDVTSKKINWEDVKYIPEELHNELYKRLSPKLNDILLAKNGTTGVAALVDRDIVFDIYVSLALIRLKKGISPRFILHQLNSKFCKKQFDMSLKGIGVPNLHLNQIRKTKIICPDIEKQTKFDEIVSEIEKQKELLEQDVKDLELLMESKMYKYFEI